MHLQPFESESETVAPDAVSSSHVCNPRNTGYVGDVLRTEMEFWDELSDEALIKIEGWGSPQGT